MVKLFLRSQDHDCPSVGIMCAPWPNAHTLGNSVRTHMAWRGVIHVSEQCTQTCKSLVWPQEFHWHKGLTSSLSWELHQTWPTNCTLLITESIVKTPCMVWRRLLFSLASHHLSMTLLRVNLTITDPQIASISPWLSFHLKFIRQYFIFRWKLYLEKVFPIYSFTKLEGWWYSVCQFFFFFFTKDPTVSKMTINGNQLPDDTLVLTVYNSKSTQLHSPNNWINCKNTMYGLT